MRIQGGGAGGGGGRARGQEKGQEENKNKKTACLTKVVVLLERRAHFEMKKQ